VVSLAAFERACVLVRVPLSGSCDSQAWKGLRFGVTVQVRAAIRYGALQKHALITFFGFVAITVPSVVAMCILSHGSFKRLRQTSLEQSFILINAHTQQAQATPLSTSCCSRTAQQFAYKHAYAACKHGAEPNRPGNPAQKCRNLSPAGRRTI
jgi:hypothetical protein